MHIVPCTTLYIGVIWYFKTVTTTSDALATQKASKEHCHTHCSPLIEFEGSTGRVIG